MINVRNLKLELGIGNLSLRNYIEIDGITSLINEIGNLSLMT